MDIATSRAESRTLTNWIRHGTFDPANRFGFTQNGEYLAFRAMQSADNSAVDSAFYRGFFSTLDLLNPVY